MTYFGKHSPERYCAKYDLSYHDILEKIQDNPIGWRSTFLAKIRRLLPE